MVDSLPLRIFLASPGDLDNERTIVNSCVEEFNALNKTKYSEKFEVVGWEQVRGTARRPQEAINELIRESHFLIVLFKESWGSEPGSPWGYTSGTEEELFTGLLELGQPDQPMRDIWVAFVDCPSPDIQIEVLRKQMAQSHSMMYETIANSRELKEKLGNRLEGWAKSAESKVPKHINLTSSSGKDVLKPSRLRLDGEKLIELGQTSSGKALLEKAAALGGPVEFLAYAKFLSRHGELEKANTFIQEAIVYFSEETSRLYSPLAAEAFAEQAGVLRRQGRDIEAIGRLEHALTLLKESNSYTEKVRCWILDALGHAYRKTGNLPIARKKFEIASDLRRKSQEELGECQSLVNLARIDLETNDLDSAAKNATKVLMVLQGMPPTALYANALTLSAEILLKQRQVDKGILDAQHAVALNRQLANRYGEAISLYVLAECYRESGDKNEAEKHARDCLQLNQSMENKFGIQRAEGILKLLASLDVY